METDACHLELDTYDFFNCFLSVVPTPIYPQTLPLSPALAPAQDRPWEWPALNIVAFEWGDYRAATGPDWKDRKRAPIRDK
ncbi:hypothetical protein EYF80_052047 [Liparis tanakae]|uniref:Uncharacterized protein n=1 Tax=Liparis tanakae TaxID=230148 RepID=A0A4Z2F9E5_9TELE|nr:hypothetical protein EYF80_052047 [Liparis tanakae]